MNKELKTILNNIQLNLAALASKTTARDAAAENKIAETDTKITAQGEDIATNEAALDFVTEQLLPDQSDRTDELEAAVDYILTEVIPGLLN